MILILVPLGNGNGNITLLEPPRTLEQTRGWNRCKGLFFILRTGEGRTSDIDYGDGIIESDILSDGDESNSELVPSELLTEAAFGFTATILCGGEDALEVTTGMTMGDTERLSGFVASRILAAAADAEGGGVTGPQIDIAAAAAAGGLEDGVRTRGVGDGGGEESPDAVVVADAVRR